jgi:hypothetical protein
MGGKDGGENGVGVQAEAQAELGRVNGVPKPELRNEGRGGAASSGGFRSG